MTSRRRRALRIVAISGALAAALPLVAASAGAAPCRPSAPSGCTLRELATPLGFRIGATAEEAQTHDPAYAAVLAREFNAVTPENAMKWYTIQAAPGVWNFGPADAIVDFADAHGMAVRGHNLVWAQDRFTPAWVRAISDPVVLRSVVQEQIRMVLQRYEGRVHRYDVVNEPLASVGTTPADSVFWRVLGPDWIAEVFRYAHLVDPNAELWLNEYGTDWVPGKHAALLALVRDLVARGVPIHGVGIQTHRPSSSGPRAAFEQQLRDYTALGLEVAVTELDVVTSPTDPQAFSRQATAYRTVVQMCLAVPGCNEVTTWGVTDASTWLDSQALYKTPTRPLLFDDRYQPKPAYDAVRDELAEASAASTSTTTTTTTAVASSGPGTSTAMPDPPASPAQPVAAAPTLTG